MEGVNVMRYNDVLLPLYPAVPAQVGVLSYTVNQLSSNTLMTAIVGRMQLDKKQ